MEQKTVNQGIILDVVKSILETENFEATARKIFDAGCLLTGANSGYVALLSEDGMENEVLFLNSGGLKCTVDESLPMPIRGLRAESYKTGRAVFHNDFMNSEWLQFLPEGHVVMKNVLFSPLNVKGQTLGLIGLANKPDDFNETDCEIMESLGMYAAIALEKSMNLERLKQSEEKYKQLYELKSLLVSDIHHRVKNNMQVLVALLQSQMSYGETKTTSEAISAAIGRINSIMVLYDNIYRKEQFEVYPVHEYIPDLINHIMLNYDKEVELDLEVEEMTVEYSIMFPLSLIINELVSNAMKYAFRNNGRHRLEVKFKPGEKETSLYIRDNGKGFHTDHMQSGFGLELVQILTRQIHGSFKIKNNGGTECLVKFQTP